jgi:peptidyl-prolyl cis-trans isomerase SurA
MAPVPAQTAGRGEQPEAAAPSGGLVLDRVVAVVNDEAVTLSEIQEEGQPVVRKIFQDFVGPERERRLEEAQQQVLNDLIDRRLMYQLAKREGMLPSTAEVNGAIEELKRNNKATDDAQFRAMLKAEGLTIEQVRRTVAERLAIGRLIARQVRSSIIISEDELLKYYESNREKFQRVPEAEMRHILFVPPPGEAGEAAIRDRAEEARAKIIAGADFAEVGRQYSDPSSGASGTETITVHRGELAPEIEAAAFGLPPGAVSPPIRTAAGLHLIKVERVQTEPVAPFAEVRESIRDQLFQEKFEGKRKEWLAGLRSRASIHMVMQTSDLQAHSAKP